VFTDGITNKLLGCFYEESPEDVVLVRVYGHKTDLLIDRNAETRNIQVLVFLIFIFFNALVFNFSVLGFTAISSQ
jgi:ethanolamine kinase